MGVVRAGVGVFVPRVAKAKIGCSGNGNRKSLGMGERRFRRFTALKAIFFFNSPIFLNLGTFLKGVYFFKTQYAFCKFLRFGNFIFGEWF